MTNDAQIDYWNGAPSDKWVRHQSEMDAVFEEHGTMMLDAASLAPGMDVLDVGCGCGATSIETSRRVGPSGRVHGVDISAPMLARATERARAEARPNLAFERADAQTHAFEGERYHAVVSRLGVMFFDDPVAAFTNLHGALRPGGRLAFVCWQATTENPWISLPMEIVSRFTPTEPMGGPGPGPFSLANAARIRDVLGRATFEDARVETASIPVRFGRTADEAARMLILLGPAGRALLAAEESTKARATASLVEELTPFVAPTGIVMDSRAWIVTARRADWRSVTPSLIV